MTKRIKIVFAGDSGVGKTSIANRLVKKEFLPTNPTIGAANFSISIGDYIFNIWDTAGQERYRSLGPMYYSGTNCAILVFDVNSRTSFQSISSFYESIRESALENCVYILIGNKIDLDNREISNQEAVELSKQIQAYFYVECSAKTGEGLIDLLEQIKDCPQLHYEEEKKVDMTLNNQEKDDRSCNC